VRITLDCTFPIGTLLCLHQPTFIHAQEDCMDDIPDPSHARMHIPAPQPMPSEPPLRQRIREHLGTDPTGLPVISESFDPSEHPNVQLAFEAYLEQEGHSAELLGVFSEQKRYMGLTFSDLVAQRPAGMGMMGPPPPMPGPVEYSNVTLADGSILPCLQSGLFLIKDHSEPLAALVSIPAEHGPRRGGVYVEVIAPTREREERFLTDLRRLVRDRNVYRNQVLSLTIDMYGQFGLYFHQLPKVDRDQIILPEEVLERVERHTIRFARHRDRLLAAGQHLKRGLLLHGPPGTGKTLTAMYLAAQMRERTILLLTGRSLGLLQRTATMARALQPSMVILEDVDLIAEERTRSPMGSGPLLYELLNEMDGLADDVDTIFLLTTNRPDLLEPALAARPGRIDQAIEIPLPDSECRRRLLKLYAREVATDVTNWDDIIRRTDGVSAAFIRELVRKAVVFAADEDTSVITNHHLDEALHELVIAGGDLTKSLLGAQGLEPEAQGE
jgi:hypothetical protein